ncbi:MAG: hypothetical protein MJZ89_03485 [Paludibacteraceae bacterium]|nr:hypothetical protein [Paludibacteraceae bacterium]
MSNTTKYCLIYAILSQETSERLNMGVLAFGDGKVFYRYSERKLEALKQILPKESFDFYCGVLSSLETKSISSSSIDYLNRYSNNLFAVSEVKTVDMPFSAETQQWLYHNYVDVVA